MPARTRTVGLAAVAALAVIGVVGAAVWWGSRPAQATAADREVADAFLGQIRAGQADAAWDGTTADFKSYLGREQFRKFVRDHPALKGPAEFADFRMADRNGVPVAEYTFRPTGRPATVTVLLADDGGRWKVAGLTVE